MSKTQSFASSFYIQVLWHACRIMNSHSACLPNYCIRPKLVRCVKPWHPMQPDTGPDTIFQLTTLNLLRNGNIYFMPALDLNDLLMLMTIMSDVIISSVLVITKLLSAYVLVQVQKLYMNLSVLKHTTCMCMVFHSILFFTFHNCNRTS